MSYWEGSGKGEAAGVMMRSSGQQHCHGTVEVLDLPLEAVYLNYQTAGSSSEELRVQVPVEQDNER